METGLAPPSVWDLNADVNRMKTEQPLQVLASLFSTFKTFNILILFLGCALYQDY